MLRKKLLLGTFALLLLNCSKDLDEVSTTENYENTSTVTAELAFPDEKGEIIVLNSKSTNPVTVSYIDNQYIWGGDMILTPEQIQQLSDNDPSKRTGLSNFADKWPNGQVFFTIASNLPNQNRVTDAIAHWQANVPSLQFIQRTNQSNYIEFVVGRGCSSSLGMIGGRQRINLAAGCSTGNTIHEIGHALGLFHEQQRADREDDIIINWNNIENGRDHNFETYVDRGMNGFEFGPFDFGSIMMYGSFFFSDNGQPTITRLDGSTFNIQRTALSNGDIETASFMYDRPNINGANTICSSNQTYTLDTFVPTPPVWTVSNNLQIISSNNTSITVSAINPNSSQSGWIRTNMNGLIASKNVWIGKPTTPSALLHVTRFGCTMGEISVDAFGGVESYDWQVSGGTIVIPNTGGSNTYSGTSSTIFVDPIDGPYGFTVKVRTRNACGVTSYYTKHIPTDCNPNGGGGETPL